MKMMSTLSVIESFASSYDGQPISLTRYENGCLTPDMGSVFIALDPSVKANGCLQVSTECIRITLVLIRVTLTSGRANSCLQVVCIVLSSFRQSVCVTISHHQNILPGASRQPQNGPSGHSVDRFPSFRFKC